MKNMAISENHLYSKVYAKGEKVFCKHIAVYVLTDYRASRLARENPLKTKVNRVGITVTKKIGKAVVRTRVRRIVREAYRLVEKEYDVRHGKLVVLVARAAAVDAKSTDVMGDLVYALKKLGMLGERK
ncbi:MAG: ribonuclease P protein component [Clostridia bacterium]|jgi:ribonuclease P protein component|nr:ribonuclease P protein component [Clostridia bacterium]